MLRISLDGAERVWDARSGEPISPPLKLAERVRHASLGPDGRRVLTLSLDGLVRMWDENLGWRDSNPLKDVGGAVDGWFGPEGPRSPRRQRESDDTSLGRRHTSAGLASAETSRKPLSRVV